MPAVPALPPVVLVTGPEDLLVDRAIHTVADRLRGNGSGGNAEPAARTGEQGEEVEVVRVNAADIGAGAVAGHTSPSLFGGPRMVVVRDVQDAAKDVVNDLTAYLSDPAPEVVLVLTHSGGARGRPVLDAARKAGAEEIACPKPARPSERVGFVRDEFRAAGRSISEPAARALVDAVGSDLRELAGACSQLVSDTEGPVDEDVVARYYRGRAEVTSFQVADAAVEGRTVDALAQLRWLLAVGGSPLGVTSALAQGLRQIVRVATAPRSATPADIARELAMPPWKVDRVRRQVRGWAPEGLAAAVHAVAEADEQVKTGADKAYAVERCVVAVAAAHGAR